MCLSYIIENQNNIWVYDCENVKLNVVLKYYILRRCTLLNIFNTFFLSTMDMLPFRKISCITFSNSSFVRVLRRTNSFENKTTVYITKFVSYFNSKYYIFTDWLLYFNCGNLYFNSTTIKFYQFVRIFTRTLSIHNESLYYKLLVILVSF